MLSWIAGALLLTVFVLLLGLLHSRRQRRKSSAEMRDYMRRNFRIGEKPWQ
jgi:hypothetical protein